MPQRSARAGTREATRPPRAPPASAAPAITPAIGQSMRPAGEEDAGGHDVDDERDELLESIDPHERVGEHDAERGEDGRVVLRVLRRWCVR